MIQPSGNVTTGPNGYVELCGHTLQIDCESVECVVCDTSFEVPEMFAKSGGKELVMYKLYAAGMFDVQECSDVPKNGYSEYHKRIAKTADDHIQQGDEFDINGRTYVYAGNGHFNTKRSKTFVSILDLIEQNGKDAIEQFPYAVSALAEIHRKNEPEY